MPSSPTTQPTHIRPELHEFKSSAIEFEDVNRLRRIRLRVARWCSFDVRRMLSLLFCVSVPIVEGELGRKDLTVLALPDEVGFASATADVVHFLRRISKM